VFLPHVLHQAGVGLLDADERVEFVEPVGVLPCRVVHVEVGDANVVLRRSAVLACEHLSATLVLCTPGGLHLFSCALERLDRHRVHGGAETDSNRVSVADRLLEQFVFLSAEPVGHRDHIVEAREKDIAVP
jgi:hypothetical protein